MYFKIINPGTLDIECAYTAPEPQPWGGPWGQFPHVAVPEGMDPDCVRATSREETIVVEDEPERVIPAEGSYDRQEVIVPESIDPVTGDVIPEHTELRDVWVETKPEEVVPAVTHEEQRTVYELELDPALVAAKAERAKLALVSEAYGRMDRDVYAEMERVYGTKKSDSATAFYLSWQDMLAAPDAYVGAMFPSANAVSNYATLKLQLAREYSVWRLGRIAQFEAERAAILAEG